MYKYILNIFLLIPILLLGNDYNRDIDSLNKKAKEYIHIDLDSAYYFANRSVVLSKHHQYKQGEMDGTFQLGRVYLDQARRVLALESGIESLKIADEIDSYKGRKNACNLLIKIYKNACYVNHPRWLHHHQRCDLARLAKPPPAMAHGQVF